MIYDDYRTDFAVLPCFAMFCQSFPLHFDGILGPLPVASGRPIQKWSIQALNPELAKQQKLGNSATESSRYTAVHMDLQADFPVATNEIPSSRMRKIPHCCF